MEFTSTAGGRFLVYIWDQFCLLQKPSYSIRHPFRGVAETARNLSIRKINPDLTDAISSFSDPEATSSSAVFNIPMESRRSSTGGISAAQRDLENWLPASQREFNSITKNLKIKRIDAEFCGKKANDTFLRNTQSKILHNKYDSRYRKLLQT